MSPVKELLEAVERGWKKAMPEISGFPESMLRERARDLVKGFMWFAFVKSSDPEKQRGLEKLRDLCTEVIKILDILVPGWTE